MNNFDNNINRMVFSK